MKRNKHSLSHYKLLTADMGRLVPVACFEVLPGDTVQQATSMLLRVSPLMAPVMHPVNVKVHHWFVPHRLVWDGWEDFITGGPDGMGSDLDFPVINIGPQGLSSGCVLDYLGVPAGTKNSVVSALPALSYVKIWNEFYRDQDLQAEVTGLGEYWADPLPVTWEKDYFTSARPWPQKGPDVSLPLAISAPVVPTGDGNPIFRTPGGDMNIITNNNSNAAYWGGPIQTQDANVGWADPKLRADLTSASAVNVNELRYAFALQRYEEARARYGSRYTEYLRYLGVRSSDARLQRPEYLGGGKQTISFSEVLQTAPGVDAESWETGVGSMAGHGISAMRSRRYRRFFEEHGLVISLMSVRPKSLYMKHMPRMYGRRTKEDYWQKELEHIGQQEVYMREIYAHADDQQPGSTGGATVFGYQDRYAEYKHIQSTVHGDFQNTMKHWHYGRDMVSQPALNNDFVRCDATDRVYASADTHPLWVMVNNSIQARRMVTKGSGSRIM